MAQWLGQYSGHTHATRIEDTEDSLRLAVEALRSTATGPDRAKKAKAVNRLAKRLLSVRVKLLKERIEKTTAEIQTGRLPADRAKEIAMLEQTCATIRERGLDAILQEFDAPD